MKLHAPFVQLPLQFDAGRLAEEVAVFPGDAWRQVAQSPAVYTLPLICAGGNLDGGATSAPMRPTGHLGRCPYLMEVLAHLDAPWGKVRLVKLGDHAGITHDADASYYGMDHMSLHVPIATPGMRFVGSGVEIRMEAGECWVVDTWREHRVVSDGRGEGIHLVADTVGGRKFRDLFARARVHRQGTPDWRPQIPVPSGQPGRLRFESIGAPQVMTPWELRERIGLLLGDTRPHPKLAPVRGSLARFTDTWHMLWTRYGVDVQGRGAYKRALENIVQDMELEATELRLGNRVAFLQALRGIVLDTALSRDETPAA